MAQIIADRVRDTSFTTGPGPFAVSGIAPIGYRPFSAVCGSGDILRVLVHNQAVPTEWIVATATYSAANQLTMTTIEASSAGGTPVSFSAGTKDIVHVFSATQFSNGTIARNVKDYGAKGDGVTDDRPAIQACIDAVAALGGGNVMVPATSAYYLLDSYVTMPAGVYVLNIPSKVNFIGEGDPFIKQGPGASPAGVSMLLLNLQSLFFWPHMAYQVFNDGTLYGGYYTLQPIAANDVTVTFATAGDTSHFAVGDYILLNDNITGDVVNMETSRVLAVGTGTLTLDRRITRSFATPSIANCNLNNTHVHDISIRGMTVQGDCPLRLTALFDCVFEDCTFIGNGTRAGGNHGISGNGLRDCVFNNCVFKYDNGTNSWELPERNSMYITFTNCSFAGTTAGCGEYAAHWLFEGNSFDMTPASTDSIAVGINCFDCSFVNNTIRSSNITAAGGACLAENYGPTYETNQKSRIIGNHIIIGNGAVTNNAIQIGHPDTIVANNTVYGGHIYINTTGSNNIISGNYIDIAPGIFTGILVHSNEPNNVVIVGNQIIQSAGVGQYGIIIDDPGTPWSGRASITGNIIRGFTLANILNTFSQTPNFQIIDQTLNRLPTQLKLTADPTVAWQIDCSDRTSIVAAAGTLILGAGGGMMIINNVTSSQTAAFLLYAGGAITKLGGGAEFVSGAPGASQTGITYSGGRYVVNNGFAASQTYSIMLLKP